MPPSERRPSEHGPFSAAPGEAGALVVRVDHTGPAVEECRRRFDPGAAAGIPPHVTVLYPIPNDRLVQLDAIAAELAHHPPFQFALSALGRFPGVVHLLVEPEDPFVRLTEAVAARLGVLPYEGRFSRVVPHLTVAVRRRLPRSIRRTLEGSLPIACEAQSVDVLDQSAGRWHVIASLPLG